MNKKVLGIDVSSTTIGYGILEIDGYNIKYISSGFLKPIKDGTIIERIVDTRNKISDIINSFKPTHIAIEDIIQFMEGKSSAQTIIMLTTFNRMVGLLSHDYLGRAPELFSVMSIRHGLKINKIFPKKEDMPALVGKHLGITFPYETSKRGKIMVESYDKADGIAVALYYAFVLTNKAKAPKIKLPKKLRAKKK
jgi:hypothetical protein